MLNIERANLFSLYGVLKYISCWAVEFDSRNFSGGLLFYKGSPEYIVSGRLTSVTDRLTQDNIKITLGDFHNTDKTGHLVSIKSDLIVELCDRERKMEFVLDLQTMRFIEDIDFTYTIPVSGANTLFRFPQERLKRYYMLNSAAETPTKKELLAWFIGLIYSTRYSIKPVDSQSDVGIQFVRALSQLFVGIPAKDVDLALAPAISRMAYPSNGDLLLDIPGLSNRLIKLSSPKENKK